QVDAVEQRLQRHFNALSLRCHLLGRPKTKERYARMGATSKSIECAAAWWLSLNFLDREPSGQDSN
ncbi:MAG: hypothetical protein ACRD4V_11705, partial [Candidatus Acidiferrales bacterium]